MRITVTDFSQFATLSVLLLGLIPAPAISQEDHPNFNGTWQLDSGRSALNSGKPSVASVTIDQTASSIHLVRVMSDGGKQGAGDFKCSTDGKECEVGGSKHSFWYSGAALVEMEIGKGAVTKSTMRLDADGKTMTIDVVHVTPTAEADKLVLQRN